MSPSWTSRSSVLLCDCGSASASADDDASTSSVACKVSDTMSPLRGNARNQRRFLLPGFLLVDRPWIRPGISVLSLLLASDEPEPPGPAVGMRFAPLAGFAPGAGFFGFTGFAPGFGARA